MTAAIDIITISITIGICSARSSPGSVRRPGKNPNRTTSATPTRNRSADVFAAGFSNGRAAAAVGGGTSPAGEPRLVSRVVLQVLADEHRNDRRGESRRSSVAGTQIIRICGRPHCVTPFSANSPIIAAVAAATGLAVMACCDAMVATAIGRSGRMPFWCAVS